MPSWDRAEGREQYVHRPPVRLRWKVVYPALIVVVMIVAAIAVASAEAHHGADATSPISGIDYVHDCPPADDACLATTERLEHLHTQLAGIWASISQDQWTQLDAIQTAVENPPAAEGGSNDQNVQTATMYGTWVLVGTLLVSLFGAAFTRAWNFWR